MDSFRLRATRMHHAHEGGRASRRTHCSARTHTPRRRVQATRASARAPPTTHERVAAALGSSSLRRKSVEARSMSCASPSWPEPSSKASKTARSRSESEPLSAVARAATSSASAARGCENGGCARLCARHGGCGGREARRQGGRQQSAVAGRRTAPRH
eukprot:4896728-Prymnesium_polylepis.1